MFYPCPQLRLYFHDGNGHPLVGGKLKTFVSNSTIPIRTTQTYRNAEGTILNPTEITLDERGECSVFLTAGVIYRFELYDADGALVFEQDGISVASGGGSGESSTIVVESGSDGIDVQQSVMDSGVVIYTISAKTIEDAVVAETERAKGAEGALSEDIADEVERATAAEKAAKTEVVAGNNIDVTKTTGANGQDVYSITGLVEATGVFGVYARNGDAWSRTRGDADIANLTAGNYHYTLFIGYSVSTPSNVIAEIESNAGIQTHKAKVDCSYAHDGWVEFSGDYYGTSLNPTLVFPTGVSLYPAAYLFVHSTAGGGSGGSGDADIVVFKISYSTSVADYVYPTYQEVANAVSAGKMPVILRYAHNSSVQHCFVFRWLSEDYIHFDNGSQYVEISNEDAVKTGYVNDKNLAADYDPTATYDIGEYCVYHNELFVCTTDILVAEEWNGSHWRRTSMSDIVGNVETILAAL